ncbi:MAG: ATP-binding protein [Clostridia bacterium]|nr:ATP-binding protein [Clostridia bacterium]
MLKRKIENDLQRWLETSSKALLVTGARQVGKTYIIRSILKNNGMDYVEYNLIEEGNLIKILDSAENVDDLVLKLSLYSRKKLTPGKTMIFFDEIQEYPEIITKIKFMVEDGRFRYILSGSLLGVELKNIRSAPVGSLETLIMFPLDFEEFLQIAHLPDGLLDTLRRCFEECEPVDPIIHERMLRLFNIYLIVGGMPDAVEAYVKSSDMAEVMRVHRDIVLQYKRDFTKYESQDKKLLLTRVYDLIPSELNSKNNRFKLTSVDQKVRIDRNGNTFVWLAEAGVAIPVYNVTAPVFPLELNEKSSFFKLFLSDVGMLTTQYGRTTKLRIIENEKGVNEGAIYENFAAQELLAHGFTSYYYQSKKTGENDFIVEYQDAVLPIEIKSGKDYTAHAALDNILSVIDYDIQRAFVFCRGNVSKKDRIAYYPIYMLMFLTNSYPGKTIIPLDDFNF